MTVREKSRLNAQAAFARMVATFRALLRALDLSGQSPVGLLPGRSAQAYAAMWAAIDVPRPGCEVSGPASMLSRCNLALSRSGRTSVVVLQMPLCGHVIDPDDPTSLKTALPERAEIVDIFAQIGRDLPQFGKSYYRIFDGFVLLFAISGFSSMADRRRLFCIFMCKVILCLWITIGSCEMAEAPCARPGD